MARELLPRDLFDLPADGDDEAIVGRGPNMLLRDRARRLAGRRRLLDQPVGRGQPNLPGDVAAVETLLRQTGDLGFRPDHEPTGYFSVARTRRPGTFSTATALRSTASSTPTARPSGRSRTRASAARAAMCASARRHASRTNQQIRIDEAQEDFEATSATVIALSEEADSLNSRNDLQLAITVISGGVPAALAIRAGLGIVAALREFARGAVSDIPQLLGAQRDAEDLARRFEDAINQFQRRHQHLQDLLTERRELLQARAEMGCA